MGAGVSRGGEGGLLAALLGRLGLVGGHRLARLEEESARAGQLGARLLELDSRLRLREDEVNNLSRELARQGQQREQLLEQVARTQEERRSFEQRTEETHRMFKEIEQLREVVLQRQEVVTAAKIGADGEEWVLECLQRAFPTNTSICRTTSPHSGDILLRTAAGKIVMVEVKDHKNPGSIVGRNNGTDMKRFYKDLAGPAVHAAVLVSLNGPVDPNTEPLAPIWADSKPCLYVDSLRTQYPDPVCLLRVVVQMVEFLLEVGGGRNGDAGLHVRLEGYLHTVRSLGLATQKLARSNETERRALEQLRSGVDGLQAALLRDRDAGGLTGGTDDA
jgi:hypothetical protein